MNRFLTLFFLIAFICLAATSGDAVEQRPFQLADLHALKDISDPQISPDGSRIICAVSETSADRRRTSTNLWVIPTAGGAAKRLTGDEATESNARWSPDSKQVAYYSTRGGGFGLWVANLDANLNASEPRLVARIQRTNFHLKNAGESFVWSPDGKKIAFLTSPESVPGAALVLPNNPGMVGIPERLRRPLTRAEIDQLPTETRNMILRAQGLSTNTPPEPATGNAPPVNTPSPADPRPTDDDPRIITRLQYKSRTSFSDSIQSHIYFADLASGEIKQLTATSFYDHSLNWSPRGDEIVYISNHEPNPDKINNSDIFVVNSKTGVVKQLTKTKGCEWAPVFSPDGTEIAFLATTREVTTIDSVAEDTHVHLIPARGGAARDVSKALDRRAQAMKWAPDGQGLLFTAGDHGRTVLYRATREGQISPVIERPAQIGGFSVARATQAIALTLSDAAHPAEVQLADAKGQLKQMSEFNRAASASWTLTAPRQFTFNNDNFEVEGWLYPPLKLDPEKKYPVILSIHGGPHGMSGYGFNTTVQLLAARGYAVLLINPRGSSGYGQAFSDGCVNDWGGGDYRDLMKGVDTALARFPFLDAARMGVTGGSYGGYMTNWIVTQTDRFKAGVTLASVSNLISFYATSLYQDLIHAEFNGMPWDNYDKLWERSPVAHIKKAKTPLLIIHGELDNDVHITQAEEMYTGLKMRDVEAVFVRYPREGHGFREPRHREDQVSRTIAWFDRYLQK
jgi:dipeptidyl aminopeptidase/acylaminoacyl peptidase